MNTSENAIEIFDKFAYEYQEKFMNVDMYAHSLNFFCESIPKKNAEILEIGCGPGNITKFLLEKRTDFKILATDLAPRMLRLCEKNNPSAEVQILDCRNILSLNKKFDAVIGGFCLPYLSKEDVFKLIKNVSQILNPNGIFYFSTMEDDYKASGYKKGSSGDEMYMYFHEKDYLVQELKKNNFKLKKWERIEYDSPDSKTVDLIIIASKKFHDENK
ncbi:MAG TPA: class I SAM-dependent methyltransferase [Salinimicrobium sp.]|nr:class I SAM-dependent methyltransferase [Salinimicrobium sp.]